MARRILLVCGILASVAYVIADLLAAVRHPEYHSFTSQSFSELSAIGAPSRSVVVSLLTVHSLMALAFGVGVWRSAGEDRRLCRAGRLLIALGLVDVIVAPFFPMHVRGAEATPTDAMHILVTIVTVALILLAIWFASASFGMRFRAYSIATIVVLIVCGSLAGLDGPKIAAHEPTPWVGVTERINIGGYLLWMTVLAIVLLRSPETPAQNRARAHVSLRSITRLVLGGWLAFGTLNALAGGLYGLAGAEGVRTTR